MLLLLFVVTGMIAVQSLRCGNCRAVCVCVCVCVTSVDLFVLPKLSLAWSRSPPVPFLRPVYLKNVHDVVRCLCCLCVLVLMCRACPCPRPPLPRCGSLFIASRNASPKVICIKLGKEVVPFSDRIMNILVEVFKNKQAVAQVCLLLLLSCFFLCFVFRERFACAFCSRVESVLVYFLDLISF